MQFSILVENSSNVISRVAGYSAEEVTSEQPYSR